MQPVTVEVLNTDRSSEASAAPTRQNAERAGKMIECHLWISCCWSEHCAPLL